MIEVVMPMAGKGSRFKENNILTPKPLLMAGEKCFFETALSSLGPLKNNYRLTFITCIDDNLKEQIEKLTSSYKVKIQILELENRTSGPAETLYMCKDIINTDLPLISLDCDLFFSCDLYFKSLSQLPVTNDNHGFLSYFHSNDPRYSYVDTNEKGFVSQVAEKKVISNYAIIGSYAFSKGHLFFDNFKKLDKNLGEKYVSDRDKLSVRFGPLLGVLKEADYWARKNRARYVTDKYVVKAFNEYRISIC